MLTQMWLFNGKFHIKKTPTKPERTEKTPEYSFQPFIQSVNQPFISFIRVPTYIQTFV